MGQKNGVCKTWQSDGRYIEEIWDKDLVVRQKVFQNDILIAEFNFSGGKPDGTHTIWDNSGKRLILQENYKNGQYDGSQKLWHENGQLTRELNYSTGKKIGWQRYFDITGKSLGETNLIEGNGKVFVKYPNGQRELEEVYQNGLMSGLQKSWYQNGQLSTEYNFEDGKRVGFQHAYNENGELKIEGNLIDGNGVLKENDRNRESNYEWEFKDGYLINMASINWTGNQINFKDGNISELTYGYDGELVSYIAETKIMGNILIREDKPEIEGEVGDRSEITVKIIDGNVLYGYSLDEICMFTENKNCFIIKKICFNEYNEMIKCSE
jgi:antitoxin component YwqK of YwqJK toxin-antitoxin module